MNWKIFTVFFATFFLIAPTVYAEVRINEIAWMGSMDSSTDEWIELYNSGASGVDLSGWRIIADDGSPSITLSGTIGASMYFLIERTDDNSVPSVTADLVTPFGNGLGNAGETLRLKNAGDEEMDIVVGGTDWTNIGGDNTTKETAQRTANSWVTGVPTPRAQNVAQEGEVEGASITTTESTTTTTTSTQGTNYSSGGVQKPSMYPRSNIVAEAGSDMRGFVGFPVALRASSTGLFNEPIERATYRWNFGDGSTGEGQTQSHVFDFAGEYLVTLEVFWGGYSAKDRLSVVVMDPEVLITEFVPLASGYVRLKNNAEREIDLSGWILRGSSGTVFIFPPNTVVLPKKNITISNKISGLTGDVTTPSLFFPNGEIAHGSSDTSASAGLVAGAKDERVGGAMTTPASVHSSAQKSVIKSTVIATKESLATEPPATSSVAATLLFDGSTKSSASTLLNGASVFALLAVMLVILVGFMLMRSQRGEPTIDEEYAIIEDIIEGKEDLLTK